MKRMIAILFLGILSLAPQEDPVVDALLRALDGDVPEERERAEEALLEKGDAALPRLKAAAARASGEPLARLSGITREIECRREEEALSRAGLPVPLARAVPRFRERFFSSDEKIILEVLKESFGGKSDPSDPDAWMAGRTDFDSEEIGTLLRLVLERAKGAPLKIAALRLARHQNAHDPGALLLKLLADPDPKVREAALEAASQTAVPGGEPTFGRFLREGSQKEQELALQALYHLRTPEAGREMLPALSSPLKDLREEAIRGLSRIRDKAAIPEIRRLLEDPEGSIRVSAVWALGTFQAREALEDLLALKDDPELYVRCTVLSVIEDWRDLRGKTVVLEALEKPDDVKVIVQAITTSGSLGLKEALPALLRFLASEQDERGQAAARAIAAIGPGPHEPELVARATGADARLRALALMALTSPEPSRDALSAFNRAVSDPEYLVQKAAVAALGKARGSGVLPALKKALDLPILRADALDALAQCPEPGAGRVALPALDDPDPRIVVAAFSALQWDDVMEAIPKLEKLLEHPAHEVGEGAAALLDHLAGPRAFPAMLGALDRAAEETQKKIWGYFGQDPDARLVEAAIERYPRLSPGLREEALRAITAFPTAASTAFLGTLARERKHPDRYWAIHTLLGRGSEEALEIIRREVKTCQGQERETAAWLLVQMGRSDDEAFRIIWDPIKRMSASVRRFLVPQLAELGRPEMVPTLLEVLCDDGWFAREDLGPALAVYPRGTFDSEFRRMAARPDEAAAAAKALS
jgi:HEAT repeat protein